MNEIFKMLAMYKNDESYRVVVSKNDDKYEMILEIDNEIYDSVILNAFSLTDGSVMDIGDFKEILDFTSSFFQKEFGYNNNDIIIKIKTKPDIFQKIIDEKITSKDYRSTNIYELFYEKDLDEFHRLNESIKYPIDDDEFIKSYENDFLSRRRIYRLQRTNQISWDEYFMALSKLTSMRSKDPNTQVGACIVNPEHKILSVGYNGAPRGIDDDYFPWARSGNPLHTKYMFVCHAEMNAISNYNGPRSDFDGSTLYVDLFPCNECAKLIIQAGIKNVVYLSDKYANTDGNIAAKRLFDLAGVNYKPLEEEHQKTITLSLNPKDK